MDVQVLRDAGAGGAALVDADVDPLRGEATLENAGGAVDEGPEGGSLRGGVVEERGARLAEGDEKVAAGVRVLIEEDQTVQRAVDDVVGEVVLRGEPVVEEEGAGVRAFGRRWGGIDVLDVALAPGGHEGGGAERGIGRAWGLRGRRRSHGVRIAGDSGEPRMDSHRLRTCLDARHACVRIITHDEAEAMRLAQETAGLMGLEAVVWSATDGVRRMMLEGDPPVANTGNPAQGLRWLSQGLAKPSLVILLDLADQLQDAVNLRAFRDLIDRVSGAHIGVGLIGHDGRVGRSSILMIDHTDRIPPVIGAISARYEVSAPTDEEIKAIVKSTLRNAKRERDITIEIKDEDGFGEALVANLRGLSRRQVRQLVTEMVLDGKLTECDLDRVQRGKRAILQDAGVLEFIEAPTSLDDIGGLARLKTWLSERERSFDEGAKQYGLSPPRGILLLGVQGAGKSLAAKAIATAWRRPLMRLDAGSLFNKYIGETERNLRDALRQAEIMSPVILWIDEIEKGFSSMGSGEDGGVSRRMFGTLLTWMQEHKHPVFLVATANDIEQLPPELMRKGRFDEIFFVDLPAKDVRERIFAIHLGKRKRDAAKMNLAALADATAGFSGAEIEQVVLGGLHRAFSQKREVTQADLIDVAKHSPPLSVTRKEAIESLREWAAGRCVPAD